jgi:hypothetical protein
MVSNPPDTVPPDNEGEESGPGNTPLTIPYIFVLGLGGGLGAGIGFGLVMGAMEMMTQ